METPIGIADARVISGKKVGIIAVLRAGPVSYTHLPEVALEPKSALLGGEEGLDFSFAILEQSGPYLAPGGFVALEVGHDQAEIVADFAKKDLGYGKVEIIMDLAGIERVVIAGQ